MKRDTEAETGEKGGAKKREDRGRRAAAGPEKLIAEHEKRLATLEEELGRKTKEATEYLDTLRRVQADAENFRKRMLKEQTAFLQLASQNLVLQLLPVIDNLERALASARAGSDDEGLVEGVALIYQQLLDILTKEGLETIDPAGEPFDPLRHEAVMQVESNEHSEGTVVEVLQKGFAHRGRVLRPAMVKVSKH